MRLEPWARQGLQEHPEHSGPSGHLGLREPFQLREHLERPVHLVPWEHPERPVPLVRWVRPGRREPCPQQERPEHSERQVPSVHLVQKVQQARPVRREPSGH